MLSWETKIFSIISKTYKYKKKIKDLRKNSAILELERLLQIDDTFFSF